MVSIVSKMQLFCLSKFIQRYDSLQNGQLFSKLEEVYHVFKVHFKPLLALLLLLFPLLSMLFWLLFPLLLLLSLLLLLFPLSLLLPLLLLLLLLFPLLLLLLLRTGYKSTKGTRLNNVQPITDKLSTHQLSKLKRRRSGNYYCKHI